jgi:E3 ubiquitin-protein ligase synoviolin
MTIFREEVGAWFLVMFTALVTGKVWEWIGEGRVEILEQQPPANPRLFHARLSISLLLSIIYDMWLFSYTVHTVIQQARPNMMVMFLFEFAILTTCSLRTGFRYLLSLVEMSIVTKQTRTRLEERRKEVREQRADILRRRESEDADEAAGANREELPNEEDIDEMDIEVPGWENKGQWVLSLDLFAGKLQSRHWFSTRFWSNSASRLRKAWRVCWVLRCPNGILWPAYPHHARPVLDNTLFPQTIECTGQISKSFGRHEQVS